MSSKANSIREEYLTHIDRQKSSGLSVRKYCKQNNLIEHKFSYYRSYKLKPEKSNPVGSKFSTVKLTEPRPVNVDKSKIDPILLAQVLKALQD